jgi:YegS/Rv2252/BmrU family lipid kinase
LLEAENSYKYESVDNKFFAVISPKAGHYYENLSSDIETVFHRLGQTVSFYSFKEAPALAEQIKQAQNTGYNSFLAVGGDGTASLIASSLIGKPHRLGIIPVGTTNTIARILEIPLTTGDAIEIAAHSDNIRSVDGLEVDSRIFILNVSLGISSVSLDSVNADQKSKLGILAYAMGILRNSSGMKTQSYQIQVDGRTLDIRAVELHVTNTGVLRTPRFNIYQESRFDDGMAEILILRHWSLKEIFNAILDLLIQRKKQAIKMVARGENIIIRSQTPIAVQADGDIIRKTPVTIKVLPQAINFIVP